MACVVWCVRCSVSNNYPLFAKEPCEKVTTTEGRSSAPTALATVTHRSMLTVHDKKCDEPAYSIVSIPRRRVSQTRVPHERYYRTVYSMNSSLSSLIRPHFERSLNLLPRGRIALSRTGSYSCAATAPPTASPTALKASPTPLSSEPTTLGSCCSLEWWDPSPDVSLTPCRR